MTLTDAVVAQPVSGNTLHGLDFITFLAGDILGVWSRSAASLGEPKLALDILRPDRRYGSAHGVLVYIQFHLGQSGSMAGVVLGAGQRYRSGPSRIVPSPAVGSDEPRQIQPEEFDRR